MTEQCNPMAFEDVRAAYWAIRNMPTPPEVLKAIKARSALTRRRIDAGWPELSRDEKRLEARYERVIAEDEAAALDAYRKTRTAHQTKEQHP